MPTRGLGKGLDALIPAPGFAPEAHAGASEVPVELIKPNPRQPRALFTRAELEELAASIKEHGVIQPLIVTRDETGEGYLLIAGERRWQASKLAGRKTVPVLVRQATDQQRLELALIENIQRADLNPLEEAVAYQSLADEFKLSQEAIAARVGKSRVAVTNTLRLLKLPKAVQQALVEEKITEGHARALLGLDSARAQQATLQTILAQELNVRQTEDLVRRMSGERTAHKNAKVKPSADVLALQERLETSLGTKVALRADKKGRGTLTVHFYSNEELDTILNLLVKE
jgi:ParB family chromosome partitioning protein